MKPTRDVYHDSNIEGFETDGTFAKWLDAVAAASEGLLTASDVYFALSLVTFNGLVVGIDWKGGGGYSFKVAHWYKGYTPAEIAFAFWQKWDSSGWADHSAGIPFKAENLRHRARFLIDTISIYDRTD